MTRTRLLPVAMAIAVGMTLTGCGDDGASSTTDSPTTAGAAADDDAAATGAATDDAATDDEAPADEPTDDEASSVGDAITVTMSDYAFEGLPASVPVGTKLEVENTSENELHELVAIRIPDDEDRSVQELVELPEEEADAVFESAMPAMVLVAPPGGDQIEALGDGTFSEPGRYAVICAVPTGADPEEFLSAAEDSDGPPDVDGGPPHLVHGMHAEVVVE